MKQSTASKPLLSQGSKATVYDGSTSDGGVASPQASDAAPEKAGAFPIEPFKLCACLPPAVLLALPGPLKKIQSVTHLVLAVGVVTSAALAGDTVVNWYLFGCRTSSCQGRIIPLLFTACCCMYFLKTLGQYDEDLVVKQKEIKRAKEELGRRYKETVSELDACIAKAVDAQASLAERAFDAKRRDFQRFLQKVARDRQPAACGAQGARAGAPEFRRFVSQWLGVFEECSIDPLARPLRLVAASELEACGGGAAETAELVAGRLRAAKLQLISEQLDQDREELSGFRSVWGRLTRAHAAALASKRASLARAPPALRDLEAGAAAPPPQGGGAAPGRGGGPAEGGEDHGWVHLGGSGRLCALDAAGADESGFPVELHCCRSRCTILSAEHLQLLVAFALGLSILHFEYFVAELSKRVLMVNVALCLLCIGFVLYEFVDIDIVQQLERQLGDVLAEQERLELKRRSMLDFYAHAQDLAEVWLHRTIPRLELLKQFSEELEDSLSGDFAAGLGEMNASMAELEQSLPALPLWLSEDAMDARTRKRLGEAMVAVTRAPDVGAALSMMRTCSSALAVENGHLQKTAQAAEREAGA